MSGVAILFVTHRMDEIRELTDEVTVLRDGVVVARSPTAQVDSEGLTRLVLGFSLKDLAAAEDGRDEKPVALSVREVSGRHVDGVSFDLRAGEILGLTGLLEMGWDEIPYLLFDGRAASGEILLGSETISLEEFSPRKAIASGIVLVPADRPRDSVLAASVRENLDDADVAVVLPPWVPASTSQRARTRDLLDLFDVRPREPEWPIAQLSGGNQQKVVVARWFETRPRILLLHEPTQGVDVGARRESTRA